MRMCSTVTNLPPDHTDHVIPNVTLRVVQLTYSPLKVRGIMRKIVDFTFSFSNRLVSESLFPQFLHNDLVSFKVLMTYHYGT